MLDDALRYKPEGHGFNSLWCHWKFSLTQSFRPHYGPGVDSASNRNEYQEHFLGVKSGRYVRLTTLPPSCAVFLKSGNLNLLQHSGLVQACNGIALPLPYILMLVRQIFTLIWNGKAVPLQAWSGPEGSRKLRFPDFVTQDGGKVVSLTHRPPLTTENTGTRFC